MEKTNKNKNSTDSKKRKVIHWNPAENDKNNTADSKISKSSGGLKLKKIIYILCLLFAVWLSWRIWLVVIQPSISKNKNNSEHVDTNQNSEDLSTNFISRNVVFNARSEALHSLQIARNIANDHPRMLQEMVRIEKAFEKGEDSYSSGKYQKANNKFTETLQLVSEFRNLISLNEEANSKYNIFVELLNNLKSSRKFAAYEYERAVAKGHDAQRNLGLGKFKNSVESFDGAINILNSITAKMDTSLASNELLAKKALSHGNKEDAVKYYEMILAIHPDYQPAIFGLKRAETIEQVFALINDAKIAEQNNNLDKALSIYTKAFKLDPLSVKIQQEKSRLASEIEKQRFHKLINTAKNAVKNKDWDTAVANYEMALKNYPERVEIKKELEKTLQKKKNHTILLALKKAAKLEKEYEWSSARKEYLEILRVDADHSFASKGLLRTGNMMRTLIRYKSLIKQAKENAASGNFNEAIKLFNNAMKIKPSYLQLTEDNLILQSELKFQSKPVKIKFLSDKKTYVSIVGYKLLEKFTETELSLLPGNYKLRGRRSRYKDVLIPLKVRNGEVPGEITVICTEKHN